MDGGVDGWRGGWKDGWIPALSSDTLSAQLFSLLDINSPKSRLSLMPPWSLELRIGQGPEGELRKRPGWGQRDELAQVPTVRSSPAVCEKPTEWAEAMCQRATPTGNQCRVLLRDSAQGSPSLSPFRP